MCVCVFSVLCVARRVSVCVCTCVCEPVYCYNGMNCVYVFVCLFICLHFTNRLWLFFSRASHLIRSRRVTFHTAQQCAAHFPPAGNVSLFSFMLKLMMFVSFMSSCTYTLFTLHLQQVSFLCCGWTSLYEDCVIAL